MKRSKRISNIEAGMNGNDLYPELKNLSEEKAMHLLTGWVPGNGLAYPEAERKKDWQRYRHPLLRYWARTDIDATEKNHHKMIDMAIPGGPFTRPSAWWQYEPPEPRKTLTTGGTNTLGNEWSMDYQEDQRDYLIRLELLTEKEKQLLEAETYEH